MDIDILKRSNPLAATVQRLTGQPIVRHKINAPWREDSTPSVHIYEDGHWFDYGSGKGGDVIDFVGMYYFGASYNPLIHFKDVIDKLGGLEIAPLPASARPQVESKPKNDRDLDCTLADVRRWHETMPPERRMYWHSRGLMDPAIDQFLLGWDGKRYTIPAMYRGVLFGVKRRKADDISNDYFKEKYVGIPGSKAGIFNLDALLTTDTIVICEGEIDAMLLTQYGYPAVTTTAGAGTWKKEWARFFQARKVFVVYDNDEAGRLGRKLVQKSMRRATLRTLPENIKDIGELIEKIDWPLTWMERNLK